MQKESADYSVCFRPLNAILVRLFTSVLSRSMPQYRSGAETLYRSRGLLWLPHHANVACSQFILRNLELNDSHKYQECNEGSTTYWQLCVFTQKLVIYILVVVIIRIGPSKNYQEIINLCSLQRILNWTFFYLNYRVDSSRSAMSKNISSRSYLLEISYCPSPFCWNQIHCK